ncbi:EAL domain-containing protein [Pullulanibacillus sp. KACC 23026]|uniref:sensor domain-containing protein n=1 Tax=Pullulanibacillus sp. KACC 23026 TaxID=3028315 RepID=UPI0023B01B90|nr:EAL domain-containing protein [Pullulanibacillus sp. KACC 23026]WEG13247.1 EAL domain-containing protein [Pullulanibacillus sp. KACC 23026]
MGLQGRFFAVLFAIVYTVLMVLIHFAQQDEMSHFEVFLSIILFIPMYFLGLQFDKARYYSKQFDDIFEDGHILLWIWESKTKTSHISSGCEQIYGYTRKEFHGDPHLWLTLVYKKDKPVAQKFQIETLKGHPYSSKYRIVHKNGKIKWIQNNATPVLDKDGKLIKINGVTIDVTQQMESGITFKKLIDASPIANIIIKDHVILYSNTKGLELFGADSLKDVIGENLLTFLTEEQRNVSIQRIRQLFFDESHELSPTEFKLKQLDGTLIDVMSSGIRTTFENEEAVLVVARDITQEKKMKERLKEAEEKYRSISEESLVGVYMFDDGKVTYINKEVERILGFSREEIATMNFLDLFAEESQEIARYNLSQMLASNITTITEDVLMVTKNGDVRDIEIRSVVTTISNKKVIIGTIIDRTNEKKGQMELNKALKDLQDIKFALDESAIVCMTNTIGEIIYVNDQFCEMYQYSRDELIGKTQVLFIPNFKSDPSMKELLQTITSGRVWKGELERISKDGHSHWFETTIVPILDGESKPYNYIEIQFDITQKILSQQEVKYLAFYDSLTGLRNRNSLNKYIDEQIGRLDPSKETLSIFFIDFDRFKNINDTLGHKYGDLMLQKATDYLIECVQNKEHIFRYGGDEFVIVLRHEDPTDAEKLSQHIICRFSDNLLIKGIEVFTTPSIGISQFPHDGNNAEELLKSADLAMYYAKESGRNNFKFFHASIGERANRTVVIETELRKALKENQFVLYFQPKVHLLTNEIIGYESLIRWIHPEMGMIPPTEFIPVAEDSGLIVKLGEWVLDQTCKIANELNASKLKKTPIALNISVKQFTDANFVTISKEIIERNHCNPSLLEFEITETVMQDVFSSIKIVKELKKMGLKVSMDDFGTGYSNLSILSEMDIDILKIDRSFVQKMCESPKSLSLVKTIISMGHSLGFEVIAEGIETLQQLELLKYYHCDIGQGYYFSPPVPLEKLMNSLT